MIRKISYDALAEVSSRAPGGRKVSYDAIARNAVATGGMRFETFMTRALDHYTNQPCQQSQGCMHCNAHAIVGMMALDEQVADKPGQAADGFERALLSYRVMARNPTADSGISFDDFMARVFDHYTREPCVKPNDCMHCAACMAAGIKAIVEHRDDCPECAAIEKKRREAQAEKA